MTPKSNEPLGARRILGIIVCLIIIGFLIFSGVTGKGKELFEKPGASPTSTR